MIKIKINVNNIDKNRLFKGEKGTYLNAVLIPTPDNQYNDYMIVEDISKEERERGTKGNILGNAKEFKSDSQQHTKQDNQVNSDEIKEDDLPF